MTERLEVSGKFILFQFIDSTVSGKLANKISDVLIAANPGAESQTQPRWGKPIALGDEITDITLDDYILIEPLQWSMVEIIKLNGVEQKFWRTDITKILATGDEELIASL